MPEFWIRTIGDLIKNRVIPVLILGVVLFPFLNYAVPHLVIMAVLAAFILFSKTLIARFFSHEIYIYIALAAIMIFYSTNRFAGVNYLYLIIASCLIASLYYASDKELVDKMFFIGALFLVLYGLFQKYVTYPALLEQLNSYKGSLIDSGIFMNHIRMGRVNGLFNSSNTFAIIVPLLSYRYLIRQKYGMYIFAALGAVMLLLTSSFNLIIFMAIMVIPFVKKKKEHLILYLAFILISMIILIIIRNSDLIPKSGMNPFIMRYKNFSSAFRIWLSSPLYGHGIGSFPDLYPLYRLPGANEVKYAHNIILQHLCEGGIIFLASFVYLLFRKLRKLSFESYIPVAAVLIHNMLSFSFYSSTIMALFFIYINADKEHYRGNDK